MAAHAQPFQQMGTGQRTAISFFAPFAGKGKRADTWASLFDGLGDCAERAFQIVQQKLSMRQIPDAVPNVETLTDQGIVVEQRVFFTIKRGVATVALYIAPFGTDLYVSWDTFVLPRLSRVRMAIGAILVATPLLTCCILPFMQVMVGGALSSVSSIGGRNSGLESLIGGMGCLLFPVTCCLGILSLTSLFVVPPAFLAAVYTAISDRDPLAILRGQVSEFQQDDVIALEQAVHHTVLMTLDEIGVNTKILPAASFDGVRRRLI